MSDVSSAFGGSHGWWRRVLAIDPEDSQTTYLLSRALRQSDPAESVQMLQRFRSMQAGQDAIESIKNIGNQGYQAMERNDWTTAESLFEQAITQCGPCVLRADLEKDLGLAACHSKDFDTGQRALQEALKLKPTDADILVALQWLEQHRTEPLH